MTLAALVTLAISAGLGACGGDGPQGVPVTVLEECTRVVYVDLWGGTSIRAFEVNRAEAVSEILAAIDRDMKSTDVLAENEGVPVGTYHVFLFVDDSDSVLGSAVVRGDYLMRISGRKREVLHSLESLGTIRRMVGSQRATQISMWDVEHLQGVDEHAGEWTMHFPPASRRAE